MFIGKKEIEQQNWNEIIFKDWTKETFTEKQLSYIISEVEVWYSDFQNNCANEIVKDLLNVFEDHNLRQWDLQYVLQKLVKSYNNTFDWLIAKIFEREDVSDISTLDITRLREQYFNI